ncbi:plasmid mobilization protein [Pseudomonas sp. CJQ_13]|uniref:plasmid mobilization protein n=1 Tax=Pseudomonas sp. CJQ_13 TaxID=3367170 RepID=UPI00370CF235
MDSNTKKNKNLRVTIRFAKSELKLLEAKVCEAGYKGLGAFVRDAVLSDELKPKVTTRSIEVAFELVELASLIKDGQSGSVLLKKVAQVALINSGGAN